MSNEEFWASLGMIISGFFILLAGIIFVSVSVGGSLIAFILGGFLFVYGLLKMPM